MADDGSGEDGLDICTLWDESQPESAEVITHTHARTHTHTHTHTHAHTHTHTHTDTRTKVHIHTHTHTNTDKGTQVLIQTHKQRHKHICNLTVICKPFLTSLIQFTCCTPKRAHTLRETHTHTHTHTDTHTHTTIKQCIDIKKKMHL